MPCCSWQVPAPPPHPAHHPLCQPPSRLPPQLPQVCLCQTPLVKIVAAALKDICWYLFHLHVGLCSLGLGWLVSNHHHCPTGVRARKDLLNMFLSPALKCPTRSSLCLMHFSSLWKQERLTCTIWFDPSQMSSGCCLGSS